MVHTDRQKRRERKVDVTTMTNEQLDQVMQTLTSKFNDIINKAVEEAKQIASPYGLDVKMSFIVDTKENLDELEAEIKQEN